MDLFEEVKNYENLPLAERVRPVVIDEIVGQEHIIGPGRLLRRAIEADRLSTLILFGPPGSGKTTIGKVIASVTRKHFVSVSATDTGIAELKQIISDALRLYSYKKTATIIFIDEIHRFNKAQQDVLLPYLERKEIVLIGATTHNPLFFITPALISRSLIFELKPISADGIKTILKRAITHPKGFPGIKVCVEEEAFEHLSIACDGDARKALNALEIAILTTEESSDGVRYITLKIAEDSIQKKAVLYDHDEDGHYDTISAFIKSIRGSDPDAAVYWLAKMLYAGEDPRFIARRLIIAASEDIGNADPLGLCVATAAANAVEFVGMPEARIILSQATIYLATAPKSNACYRAIESAYRDIEKGLTHHIPEHLKNVHLPSQGKDLSKDYLYPHNFKDHFVEQYYGVPSLYYEPSEQGFEVTISERLKEWRTRLKKNIKKNTRDYE